MTGRIVVGVDGSDSSRRALAQAYEEARLRGATVEVVHAYALPLVPPVPEFTGVPDPEDAKRAALAVISQIVGVVPLDVDVTRIATHGPPAKTLLRMAEGADLLVVGSRGRGGFRGLVLGSTSHQVVSHATCPVLVVPHEVQPAETAGGTRQRRRDRSDRRVPSRG